MNVGDDVAPPACRAVFRFDQPAGIVVTEIAPVRGANAVVPIVPPGCIRAVAAVVIKILRLESLRIHGDPPFRVMHIVPCPRLRAPVVRIGHCDFLV